MTQELNNEKSKTGYATIDQPWMKQYHSYAGKGILDAANKGSVWDMTEESLKKNSEIPLIEYFGNTITREEFAKYVELWARTFKSLGVSKGDHIPLYVPATPESYAMFFAANAIGAIPYYQKLSISKKLWNKKQLKLKLP